MACCPLHNIGHGLVGGFGGGFPSGKPAEISGKPAKSFRDGTPETASQWCDTTAQAADDLFEKPGPRQEVIVRNTTVLPMDGRDRLEGQDIHIRNGRIIAVVPSNRFAPPAAEGAIVVDGWGKVALPGLSDLHTHPYVLNWVHSIIKRGQLPYNPECFVLPYGLQMFQYIAAGVTRIEVLSGEADMLSLRAMQQRGDIVAPTMQIGTPIIDGPVPTHGDSVSWMIADAAGGKRAAEEAVQRGYDFVKPYSALPADSYEALIRGCRDLGIRVMGHVPAAVGVERVLAMGQQGIAHAAEFFYREPAESRSDNARMERLAHATATGGVWVQATLIVLKRIELLLNSDATATDFPDSNFCHPLLNRCFGPDGEMRKGMRGPGYEIMRGVGRLGVQMLQHLHWAGAPILTGTDVPNPFICDGFSLHEELELLVGEVGMSTSEVLNSTTRLAAAYQGEPSSSGTLSPGARADLVLLDADPLQDIRATRQIDTVIVGGVLLRRAERERGLRRILDNYDSMRDILERS